MEEVISIYTKNPSPIPPNPASILRQSNKKKPDGSPSALTAVVLTESAVRLKFSSNSTNQDYYRVYKSTDNGVTYTSDGTTKRLLYEAVSLTAVNHKFYVVAVKGGVESDKSNVVNALLEPWYLAGGIDPSNILGAYKFQYVSSKVIALKNLANPGTNDLVETGNLTWLYIDGITGFSVSKYLTGAIYKSNTYSFLVKFSNALGTNSDERLFCAEEDISGTKGAFIIPATSTLGNDAYIRQASDYTGPITIAKPVSGVWGASQTAYFKDAVNIDNTLVKGGTEYSRNFRIGNHNITPHATRAFSGKVQAVVVFKNSPSDAQMIAVSQRMNDAAFTYIPERDFTYLSKYSNISILPHGTKSWNAFGTDTPYISKPIFKDGFYYALSQVSDLGVTSWTKFTLNKSADLKTWIDCGVVFNAGSPGAWDDAYIVHPCIKEKDGVYYMFYSAQASGSKIGLATSTDLYNWTKYSGNPVYTGHGGKYAYAPTIIQIGSKYVIYYWNGGVNSATTCLEYITSDDLINWTFGFGAVYVASTDWDYFSGNGIEIDPWIIKNRAGYYEMMYTAGNPGVHQDIGYLSSLDGYIWKKRQSLVIDQSGSGFDATYLGDPVLLELDNGDAFLFYAGMSGPYPGTATDAGLYLL